MNLIPLLLLLAVSPSQTNLDADIDSGGWGSTQARAFAVSTFASTGYSTHLIYSAIVLPNGQRVVLEAQCPGPDPYFCLPERLGSCDKSTTTLTGVDGKGWPYTEVVTACDVPAYGQCLSMAGTFGEPLRAAQSFTLIVDWMSDGLGCPA